MLKHFSNLIHATSTRVFGSMKSNGQFNRDNLGKFADKLGIAGNSIVLMKQVHGNKVEFVQNADREVISDADGILTNKRGVVLGVVTADCLPIVFYEPEKHIVGVIHAGYKGILKGILEKTIFAIERLGGIRSNVFAKIGPSIGECCYDVPEERLDLFKQKFGVSERMWNRKGKKIFLNLQKAARICLLRLGISELNISDSFLCTKCNKDTYFSFRGDTKETYGECLTIIGMR